MGKTNIIPVRVYYEDTDAGGIVFYARYLAFAERGRTELLREVGYDNITIKKEAKLAFAVRSCEVDYISPAFLDDLLEVHTSITHVGGASLTMKQNIFRNAQVITQLKLLLVCIDVSDLDAILPVKIPNDIRVAIEGFSGIKSKTS